MEAKLNHLSASLYWCVNCIKLGMIGIRISAGIGRHYSDFSNRGRYQITESQFNYNNVYINNPPIPKFPYDTLFTIMHSPTILHTYVCLHGTGSPYKSHISFSLFSVWVSVFYPRPRWSINYYFCLKTVLKKSRSGFRQQNEIMDNPDHESQSQLFLIPTNLAWDLDQPNIKCLTQVSQKTFSEYNWLRRAHIQIFQNTIYR